MPQKDAVVLGGLSPDMLLQDQPKVMEGLVLSPVRLRIDATEGGSQQCLGSVVDARTGLTCYVAVDGSTLSDQDLVAHGKEVRSRLLAEASEFDQLNTTSRLGPILEASGKYSAAPNLESLNQLRIQFRRAAAQFPDIPENLAQIDLAAVWDWLLKNNAKKTAEPETPLITYKPIPGTDPHIEPGPILFPTPTPEKP